MPIYKSEFTISATNDEIEIGSCFVHVEAKDQKEAATKIRAWLLSEIDVYLEDIYEVDEFPSYSIESPKSTLVVGREANIDKTLRMAHNGVSL